MRLKREKVEFYKKFMTTDDFDNVAKSVNFSLSTVMNLFNGGKINKKNQSIVVALDILLAKKVSAMEIEIGRYRKGIYKMGYERA